MGGQGCLLADAMIQVGSQSLTFDSEMVKMRGRPWKSKIDRIRITLVDARAKPGDVLSIHFPQRATCSFGEKQEWEGCLQAVAAAFPWLKACIR